MDVSTKVANCLHIPTHIVRSVSESRAVCLVSTEWLNNEIHKRANSSQHLEELSVPEVEEFLAPSYPALPPTLVRISVKLLSKTDDKLTRSLDSPASLTLDMRDVQGYLSEISRQNYQCLWQEYYQRYSHSRTPTESSPKQRVLDVMLEHLGRLHPDVMDHPSQSENAELFRQNIIPVLFKRETEECILIAEPYLPCTLHNALSYSTAIASLSYAKPLFILYQILNVMCTFQESGLSVGNLSLHDILVDEKLWIYVTNVNSSSFAIQSDNDEDETKDDSTDEKASKEVVDNVENDSLSDSTSTMKKGSLLSKQLNEVDSLVEDARAFIESSQRGQFDVEDLSQVTEQWCRRKLTNFRYIMILNFMAGRRMGDPNHHPVIPWVMDFTGPDTGLRDLTMSKFRLNKGDNQLDLTFEAFPQMSDSDHVPHHVSDILSDITYYVYRARRTSKAILCSHVRSKWVPNEYPSSMLRMQEWTPDECIPEFFTDPTIFSSIHDDLPDIELPPWCSSPEDFISKHMAVLESDAVSEFVHHWIDLTFGYKLTGSAATLAKNINLNLVDNHKRVQNHGVVQLFNEPHPHRASIAEVAMEAPPRVPKNMLYHQVTENKEEHDRKSSVSITYNNRPENAAIHLPKAYNPLADLNQLEELYTFSSKVMKGLPSESDSEVSSDPSQYNGLILTRDLQVLGCLGCELFLAPSLQMQDRKASLQRRYATIRQLWKDNRRVFPRPMHRFAETLLFPADKKECKAGDVLFQYPVINKDGLPLQTPNLLLSPHSNVIPFPTYFPELYSCLCKMKDKDHVIDQIRWRSSKSPSEKEKVIKVMARDKVTILQHFLEKFQGKINTEGLELLLPYVEELFSSEDTSVQAAWSLFNLIGQEIGPTETSARFLPHLSKLFSGENSTPKHMKIYHRTFLVQLLLRLGLRTFLANFSTLLVEAVAGYKDYVFEDLFLDANESSEMKEMSKTKNNTLEQDETGLPPLVEENNIEDQEEELLTQDSDEFPESSLRENEQTESTQDDVDEIEDEILDYNGYRMENDKDADSIGSYHEDEVSNRSDRSDESRSCRSETEEAASRSGEQDTTSEIREVSLDGDSISDVETKSWSEQTDGFNRAESLQFQSQDVADEFEESRPVDLSIGHKSSQKPKLFSPIGSKGMVRSETDEFARTMSDKTAEEVVNINHVAAESIKWLAVRLGPLLTAKFLSRNLIRMLALCYLGEEQLINIGDPDKKLPKTSRLICGDRNANKIIECLSHIARLYGEQVVILQYIPCAVDMLNMAKKRLTQKAEAGVISSLVLLRHILPLITDKTLMDILKDTIIKELLKPAIRLISSTNHSFPGGSTVRTASSHKLIDVIYVIGLRLGFEMTRSNLTGVLSDFFQCFNQVHGITAAIHRSGSSNKLLDSDKSHGLVRSQGSTDETYCNIKMDSSTQEVMIGTPVSVLSIGSSSPLSPTSWSVRKSHSLSNALEDRDDAFDMSGRDRENIQQEIENVFTPELAYASYIPFCRIFGSIHMEQHLPNEDLIRRLCAQYDMQFDVDSSESGSEPQSPCQEELGPPLENHTERTGNKIQLPTTDSSGMDFIKFGPIHRSSKILKLDPDEVKCDMKERSRHLKGNWLLYWEHELGLSERDTLFNFKQIKLHTFEGHGSSIRSLTVLDNENSFISASKDKTVKLWSIKGFGDGNGRSRCQMTYPHHKKSIFSVVYLESVRLVATCDSSVHIWDPFTSETICQLDTNKYLPVTAMTALPAPSPLVITATNEATLKFLDLRAGKYVHEFKTCTLSAGLVRSVAVAPDSNWVAVGFSTGYMSLLDQRAGLLQATWKGHEGEILQLKSYNRKSFISSSFDNTTKIWNVDDVKDSCILKGHTDPVHCFTMYKGQIISATTGNKIGVHSSAEAQASFTSTKLRSDTFKGVLTSMAVLPLNKTLLLGADNGSIRLLC